MLTCYTRTGQMHAALSSAEAALLPDDVVWLDLLSPDAREVALVEQSTGLKLPTFESLSEIETSSRLRTEDGVLYLSAPLVYRPGADAPVPTPLGFVLSRERLVTVRFEPLTAFGTFGEGLRHGGTGRNTSASVFSGLAEAIVDRLADVLESISAELDMLSHRAFHAGPINGDAGRHRLHEEAGLRDILRRIGRNGDLASKIRDSLLGLARIAPYVAGHGADWLSPELKAELETLRLDVHSLSDYDAHLLNKVQLLLDTTLGLINIEQNSIIKVLAVVSVVGVPPTLVASMYGMNFKTMPELDWAWGYPYALALILLSALLPLWWFKRRGWF